MEKQRTYGGIQFFRRLLILSPSRTARKIFFTLPLLLIFADPFLPSAQSPSDLQKLRVTPPPGAMYSGSEYMFSLVIPDVKPADVQADSPRMPSGVSVVSMRRTDYTEAGMQSGTEIDIRLSFRDARIYTLPPLRVRIKGRFYEIPFSDVNIEQDPASTVPRLIIKFGNGTEVSDDGADGEPLFALPAGEKILFTIYLQYAVQVIRFSWQAPKDALLTELWRYEINESAARASLFTADPIPVALFEWQPLVSGNAALPDIELTASAYSGARVKLSLPAASIRITEALPLSPDQSESNESYFSYAFSEVADPEKENTMRSVSEADCETLAALRSAERHAFFSWKASSERRAFEAKLGIASGKSEPKTVVCILLAVSCGALALLCAAAFVLKKRGLAYSLLSAFLIVSGFTVASGIRLSAVHGIFKGGDIRLVPDASSGPVSPIRSGERVRVEERAGTWMYIQYGMTGGWVASSSVAVIR